MNVLIKFKSKNLFVFAIFCSFTYLSYLIWNAKEKFPQIDVELRDLVSYIVLSVEMGGTAVSRIFLEGNEIQIVNKGKMDVGREELLTKADITSNLLMLELLRRFSLLKVITEEKSMQLSKTEMDRYRIDNYELWIGLREILSKIPTWRIPLNRVVIWVDPLDATQEYTEGLTQYVTVMACIAIDNKPFVGAIYKPFQNETILGMVDYGLISSKSGFINTWTDTTLMKMNSEKNRTILVSRSHAGQVSALVKRAFGSESPPYIIEAAGGAGYKTLRLIQKTAEIYIHTTSIKKWDLCACDAIIKAAGGALLSLGDGLPLDYSVKTSKNNEIHTDGIIMALTSPYVLYEKMKRHLNFK